MKLLVAGGAGFIGSNFVRHRLETHAEDTVRVLDKLTYAGRRENLVGLPESSGSSSSRATSPTADAARGAVEGCDAVVNFAAESHVDRSIESPGEFINTDVFGTYVLLEASRDAGIRHLQVSTDEVYGDLEEGTATEESPIEPSSPYAASKAGGDMLVSAFARTYDAEALIFRASNNYGPRQHPEKLIPLCILNALAGDELPVYGDGAQVRNWLYVEDCCAAVGAVLEAGEPGQVYNVGGPDELANIEVVKRILELHRPRRVADLLRQGPPRPRPPLLALLRPARGTRLERRRPLRRGNRPHRRVVSRQRGLVGPDPLGRVPRVLRAPLRQGAGIAMRRLPTEIDEVVLLEPDVHGDERGFLVETFRESELPDLGIDDSFVQDNHSRSEGGVLRGIHMQQGQAKLVRCPRGRIWDLAVDLRPDSPTYKRWEGHELDGESHRQLFVPGRLRPRLLRPERRGRRPLPALDLLRPRARVRRRLGRPRPRRRVADHGPDALRARQERPEARPSSRPVSSSGCHECARDPERHPGSLL